MRGPKPARALRELALQSDLPAAIPTTAGIIDTLRAEALAGRRIAVQLYGTEPNRPLVQFLEDDDKLNSGLMEEAGLQRPRWPDGRRLFVSSEFAPSQGQDLAGTHSKQRST